MFVCDFMSQERREYFSLTFHRDANPVLWHPPSNLKEQVAELVDAWLEHHDVLFSAISTKHGKNWLTLIDVPMSRVKDLLSAWYRLYQHTRTNATVLLAPGVPLARVQIVAPTTHFGFRRSHWLYKTSGYVPAAAGRNVLGVVDYFNDFPSSNDLRPLMNEYQSDGAGATFTILASGGAYNLNGPKRRGEPQHPVRLTMAYPTAHILQHQLEYPGRPARQLARLGASVPFARGDDGVGVDTHRSPYLSRFHGLRVTSVATSHDPEVTASISSGRFSITGGRSFPEIPPVLGFEVFVNGWHELFDASAMSLGVPLCLLHLQRTGRIGNYLPIEWLPVFQRQATAICVAP
ncbi:hypothetical protein H4582DRAFT_2057965 [Lactarius indigo]|nr:hypothetical protein H4582DRAFT_2057965 [Lactarius indigo]